MYKKLLFILVLAVSFTACKKNNDKKNGCVLKTCTASYEYIGVTFTDNTGKPVKPQSIKVVNLRTGKEIARPMYPPNVEFTPYLIVIVSDSNLKDFSDEGDDVDITAVNAENQQVKKTVIKISGGCNCHVSKISGPDKIAFD